MRLGRLLFCALTICFIFGTVPELSIAQDEQAEVTSKRKKKSKRRKRRSKRRKRKRERERSSSRPIGEDPYAASAEAAEASDGGESTQSDDSASETRESELPGQASLVEQSRAAPADQGSLRRSNRMEFDERLVKGQAAKSGAVYLFKRMPRQLPGLVPMRRSYRQRIVEPVLGDRALKPARPSTKLLEREKKIGHPGANGNQPDIGKKAEGSKEKEEEKVNLKKNGSKGKQGGKK